MSPLTLLSQRIRPPLNASRFIALGVLWLAAGVGVGAVAWAYRDIIALLLNWTPALARGFALNILMGVVAMLAATVFGTLLGCLQVSLHRGLRQVAVLLTQLLRNAPWLVVVFLVMNLLPFEFQALAPISAEGLTTQVVRGQYIAGYSEGQSVPGYLEEENSNTQSDTETFVALRADIRNWRWAGVPFYLRTGKRMPQKLSQIVIHFKQIPHSIFNQPTSSFQPNCLVIRLQPDEGLRMNLMAKTPGDGMRLKPAELELDFRFQGDGADVDHVRQAFQRVHRVFPVLLHGGGMCQDLLVCEHVQRRQRSSACERVARIGIAVKQLDAGRRLHESVVNKGFREHGAHRHHAVGEALGGRHQVRFDIEIVGREWRRQAAEAGDDFIENQQDAVLGAQLAQALQIAFRGNQHAGGTGHRFDDDGRDGRCIVQRDDALQFIGQVHAHFRFAPGVRVLVEVMSVRQVVDARQQRAEMLAVGADAAHRQAAVVDAVVA